MKFVNPFGRRSSNKAYRLLEQFANKAIRYTTFHQNRITPSEFSYIGTPKRRQLLSGTSGHRTYFQMGLVVCTICRLGGLGLSEIKSAALIRAPDS